jgi:hypothetical protein
MRSKYIVKVFGKEDEILILEATPDGFDVSRPPSDGSIENSIDGYVADASSASDFVVALEKITVTQIQAPQWSGAKLIRLNGQVYRDGDISKCRYMDLLLIRCLSIYDSAGFANRHYYRPKLRDLIFPSDPMMPWGGDFYRYLRHLINRNSA